MLFLLKHKALISLLVTVNFVLHSMYVPSSFADKKTKSPSIASPHLGSKHKGAKASTTSTTKLGFFQAGEFVPSFTLHDGKNAQWHSQDLLGQRAMLMLLVDAATSSHAPGSSPNSVVASTAQKALTAVKTESEALRQRNVEVVVVMVGAKRVALASATPLLHSPSSAGSRSVASLDALAPFGASANPLLFDRDGALRSLLEPRPSPITLIAIDRAGFLRLRKPLSNDVGAFTAMGMQLREVGDPTPYLKENEQAPDFMLTDMNGKVRRLSDLRGRKNLLLTFFPRCFTGGCQSELSTIQARWNDFVQSKTEVWAVSVDPVEGAKGQRAFAKSLGLEFPLIPDVGRNLCILYGAAHSPNQMAARISILIDKSGKVRWLDKQVNVKTHGDDILARMHELGISGRDAPPK